MTRFRVALAVLAVAVAAAAFAVALHPAGTPPPQAGSGTGALLIAAADRQSAPDFTGVRAWVNSAPLTMRELRGRVVLVDFWTFSCVNCVRTIPHLAALDARLRSAGLVIVGVHSPEFDFEKSTQNVTVAARRLGVTWPVAVDSGMATWNAYGNRYWPAEYLVDREGRVAYVHVGEGDDAATEDAARRLLGAGGAAAAPGESSPPPDITPELYAGSTRGTLAGGEEYGPRGHAVDHPDRGTPPDRDALSVTGRWTDEGEDLQSAGAGHVRLRFHASDVYVVAGASGPQPLTITVLLDGAAVPPERRGPDLEDGTLHVGASDLRHVLVRVPAGDHVLDLAVPPGMRLYTFTFG